MRIQTNHLSLNVIDEGVGQPVLLLHGYPDSARLWQRQIAALAAAGCRVVAPDLRGCGESDRPPIPEAYALPALVGDVIDVLDALEIERATVVGHGWGAVIGWTIAAFFPERVERLCALGVGHPCVFPAGRVLAAAPDGIPANGTPMPVPAVSCPVLCVWGSEDRCLDEAHVLASAEHVHGPWRYERIDGAGHRLPLEAPHLLARLIVDFVCTPVAA